MKEEPQQVEHLSIEALRPDPANPRRISYDSKIRPTLQRQLG